MSDTDRDADTGISPLKGESDFYVWKTMVKRHLVSLDLWNIVSGATPRPTAPESDSTTPTLPQKVWDRSSLLAHALLDRHLSQEVNRDHYHHTTPQALWKSLMERYHHNDAQSLLKSLNAISSLSYSDTSSESFSDYLTSFGQHWDDLCYRTEDAEPPKAGVPNSLETGLNIIANSDESKREFLLASIPQSMMVFVINLTDRLESDLNYFRLCNELKWYHSSLESSKEEEELEELAELALEGLD